MGAPEVRGALAAFLREHGSVASRELAERTGITRQALHRYLSGWVREGWIAREGRGRATRYRLSRDESFDRSFPTAGLSEDLVWEELRSWLDEKRVERSGAADEVLAYVVTEIVNNAVDHSGAPGVGLRANLEAGRIAVTVEDEGVGAFESVRARLGLEDYLRALQELSKGKATSQPERHTGEGIFFASKMVALFELSANGLVWTIDNEIADQSVCADPEEEVSAGTRVLFELSPRAELRPLEVFAAYTHDFEFDTTRCVVRLFRMGRRFVSRSEARRMAARLDEFREVILDFRGVEGVGQGFVDELFRVWAGDHPAVRLVPVDMSREVEFMVRRGLGGSSPER